MGKVGYIFLISLIFVWNSVAQNVTNGDPRKEKRAARDPVDFTVPVGANEIKLMTYNVENLFDAVHDSGKADYEFLPINHPMKKHCATRGRYQKACEETNWTAERMELKLQQIKRVIDAQGELPDILALQEIENENVISLLSKVLGYERFVVSDSPDERGIDLAILFNENKVRYLNHVEKVLDIPNLKSRNLLVANFKIAGTNDTLGVFNNHWPSQSKKSELRVEVAKQLRTFVNQQVGRKTRYHTVILGDFNTIDADRPHPFHEVILNPAWKMGFSDSQALFESLQLRQTVRMPPASYFFGVEGTWNKLDRIFISNNLTDSAGLDLVPDSFRIIAPEFMTRSYEFYSQDHHFYASIIFGTPKRYEHNTSNPNVAGFSDHFPVVVKLKTN